MDLKRLHVHLGNCNISFSDIYIYIYIIRGYAMKIMGTIYVLLRNVIRQHAGTALQNMLVQNRLSNTNKVFTRLHQDVSLLEPGERSRRLQPLERRVFAYQTKVCFII